MKLKDLIKLLWKYLKPYKKVVYFCIFLATFASVILAVIPLVYGRLVDEAVKPEANLKLITLILLAWLIFISLTNWISRFIELKGSELGGRVFQNFTVDTYTHYLQLPMAFHKEKKSGEELSKISRAGDQLWQLVSEVAFYLVPNFLTALIAIILMFLTEWRISLLLLIILVFYSIATIVKTKPIIKAQKTTNRFWEKTWGHIYDTAHNIQIVKLHLSENLEKQKVNNYLNKTMNKMVWFFKKWRDLSAWQNNIQGFGFVIIFGLALYLLILGQITAGVLVTFIGYVNLVFRPFNQLAYTYRQIQRGLVTVDRAVKLFNIQTEPYGKGGGNKKGSRQD